MGKGVRSKNINQMNSMDKVVLTLATTNLGKFKEFDQFLSDFPLILKSQPQDFEVEETGSSFAENARIKSIAIANLMGTWALADDSGLCVEALSGAPGIYSSRYANNDVERIQRILNELESSSNRSAYFVSNICIAAPGNEILLQVDGRCEGRITHAPRGLEGFGYDPIFEVNGTGLTFAEMPKFQKNKLGHRGKAFSKLETSLRELLGNC